MSEPPLRAVFLDIGDTVMRPNPSTGGIHSVDPVASTTTSAANDRISSASMR